MFPGVSPTLPMHPHNGRKEPRIFTGPGDATLDATDYALIINKGVACITSVFLPSGPFRGEEHLIKDGAGNASTANITIVPVGTTIDGGANYVMNVNRQAARVLFTGLEWSIV